MLTFNTKKFSTGADRQKEDAASPLVPAVLTQIDLSTAQ